MSLCRCGCKGEAPDGKAFITGHSPFNKKKQEKAPEPVVDKTLPPQPEPKVLPAPQPIPQQHQQPPPPPTRRDREIQLMELELKQIDKYMGDRHQNTQITQDERLLLAILRKDIALNPWAVSKRVCQDMGIPFNDKEFENEILVNFIDDYIDFGLPMERKGRKEVGDIFKAYFDGKNSEQEQPKEKLII